MEYTNAKKLSGIFLFIDFEKAFDSIEWNFIKRSLELFNFGRSIIKWFSILYSNSETAVMNAGFMTDYFKVSRGVRQGCPLSPFLFILSVEVLASKIRQEPNCKGISLPSLQEAKISQFADDTTLISRDTESLKCSLQIIGRFGGISGLKLNKKKTKAMWIGSSKHKNTKILEFRSTKDPIKILGAHLSYNADKNNDANFFSKIRKMKTKLNLWQTRDLTLYGKSLLAKSLGASQLIYTASLMSVPDAVINTAQSLLFSFLWKNKKDKIKRNVVCQPLKNGGLNFMNFGIMVKSLRLAWIGRLLSNSNDNWKAIPNFFFDKYGGLPFLLKCNYNTANFDNDIPLFYRELLDYFQELTETSKENNNNDLILWNNRKITIERNSVFWKQWFDCGILFISDLLNSDGKFLTLEEFQNKFQIKVNFLHYFQLIAAIPTDLKRKAFDYPIPDLLGATSEYYQMKDRTIVLTKCRSKSYYKLFIEKLDTEPSAVRSWKKHFSELPDWNNCFENIYKSSKDNKLRQFSFKVMHRIITTKKELLKYKLAFDDKCPLCLNPDSIEHTFIYCQESTDFFLKTLRWFNDYHKAKIKLSNKQILFNMFSFPSQMANSLQCRLRLMISLQKKYLYTCKNIEKKPSLDEFLIKLFEQYKIENCGKSY